MTITIIVLEGLVGKVCRCSRGRPGLVTGRKALEWGESWVGIGLDDGDPQWASRRPTIIAQDLNTYLKKEKGR